MQNETACRLSATKCALDPWNESLVEVKIYDYHDLNLPTIALNPNLHNPCKFCSSWHDEILVFDINLINIRKHNLHMICISAFCF